jgi:glutamyl-tRNA reductase
MTMHITLVGSNHQTAENLAWREKLCLAKQNIPQALQQCKEKTACQACMILSTCNRHEYIMINKSLDDSSCLEWLAEQYNLCPASFKKNTYIYHDEKAILHLIRTASGLDSLTLGEPEIFGQIKQALCISQDAGASNKMLNYLMSQVFHAAKNIRHTSNIQTYPITLPYTILKLIGQIFDLNSPCPIVCIGAGQVIETLSDYLKHKNCKDIVILNRTLESAKHLAKKVNGQAGQLSELSSWLPKAHVIVSAISKNTPIISKKQLQDSMSQRDYRPILIIDLAMPRNIDPHIQDLPDVFLYDLEHLQHIILQYQQCRQKAAKPAQAMAIEHAKCIHQNLSAKKAFKSLIEMRKTILQLRDQTLKKSKQAIQNGQDPILTLEKAVHDLTQNILHHPTIELRKAIKTQQKDIICLAEKWFAKESSDEKTT